MAGIPRAVQEAERKAEELHASIYSQDRDTGEEPTPKAAEPEQPEQPETAEEQQQGKEAEHQPEEPEGRESDTQGDEESWKHRYQTLLGKYNAEVPRLQRSQRELEQANADLRQQVGRLEQRLNTAPEPESQKQAAPEVISRETLQRYETEFGADFMEAVRAVASEMLQTETGQLRQQVEETRTELQETRRALTEREFFSELGRLVPDWAEINERQDWKDWLGEVDTFSGQPRQALLDDAAQKGEYERVAAMFQAFTGDGAPKRKDPAKDDRVASQVAPERRSGSKPPAGKPSYTMDDWKQLQKDFANGKYAGREAEFRQKEAAIHAALTG